MLQRAKNRNMSFADAMRATGGDAVAAAAMVFAEAPGDKRGADETFGDTNPASAQSARDNLYEDAVSDIAYEEPETIDEAVREAVSRADALSNPDIAGEIMLNIAPQQLPQVCGLNSFFAGICRTAGFRRAYRAKWFVSVRFLALDGTARDMAFFKTRTIREVKAAFEAAIQRPPNFTELIFGGRNPSAQSSLLGMMRYAQRNMPAFDGGDIKISYVYRMGAPYTRVSVSRHWLEDGTYIDVSRD